MQQTKSIIVTGKVQGVSFRQSTVSQARQLGLTGTVRNKSDGQSVEIIATGNEQLLQQLVRWCHTGPRGANVQSVEVNERPFSEFTMFTIIS